MTYPLILGHRGFSGEAPENTLPSFRHALEQNVDFLEFDVQLSKDGEVVVFHDDTTKRTTNATKPRTISKLLLSEIKALDAGAWFNKKYTGTTIPTLEEVLNLPRGNVGLMIELKKVGANTNIDDLIKAVGKVLLKTTTSSTNVGPIILGSLSPKVVKGILDAALPYSTIGIADTSRSLSLYQRMNLTHYAINHELVNDGLIKALHNKGCMVWSYTVNDPATARSLASIDLDGIITDQPAAIMKALHSNSSL